METPNRRRSVAAQAIFVLSLGLVALTFAPLWKPLLVAAVLAGTTHGLYRRIDRRLGHHPMVAATLMTIGVVLLLLIPVAVAASVLVREAIEAAIYVQSALEEGGLEELAARLPDRIEAMLREITARLPGDIESLSQQAAAGGMTVARFLTSLITGASRAVFALVMMLIAYFALLIDGPRMRRWVEAISPLQEHRTGELFEDFRRVSRSVLGSAVVSALTQGVVAWIGFLIAGVPQAVFFAFLTGLAALIPIVGTPIITLPIAALLLATGDIWQGIFLAIYAVGVIALVDNVVRPLIVRGGMQLNGVLVFFALLGGLLAFGAIGLIVGPLAVTFFLAMVRFTQRDAQARGH